MGWLCTRTAATARRVADLHRLLRGVLARGDRPAQAGPADTLPGTLGTVTMADGAKQITYNGHPLYTLKGAGALSTKGNGIEGKWHVIKLSKNDVTYGT